MTKGHDGPVEEPIDWAFDCMIEILNKSFTSQYIDGLTLQPFAEVYCQAVAHHLFTVHDLEAYYAKHWPDISQDCDEFQYYRTRILEGWRIYVGSLPNSYADPADDVQQMLSKIRVNHVSPEFEWYQDDDAKLWG
jgi:hypothetical protein